MNKVRIFYIIPILGCLSCAKVVVGTLPSASVPLIQLTGNVTAGPVDKSAVSIYQLTSNGSKGSLLGTATSDSSGNFSLSLATSSGSLLIEAVGGSYTEEASGTVV